MRVAREVSFFAERLQHVLNPSRLQSPDTLISFALILLNPSFSGIQAVKGSIGFAVALAYHPLSFKLKL